MRTFYFYKDEDGWFVDIPEWEGDKADLQMVAGADHFLDIIAQGEDGVHVHMDLVPFTGADELTMMHLGKLEGWEMGTGAWYKVTSFNGIAYDFPMWLCDVTKHPQVFGFFPDNIYFRKG